MSTEFPQKPEIYRNRELTPEEKADPDIDYVAIPSTEDPENVIPRNRKIEAHYMRFNLASGSGNICIGITVGDETIGDIGVTIQFEGPENSHDECMTGHNMLLEHTSERLAEILEAMFPDVDWEGRIQSFPCDKTQVKVGVLEAIDRLRGRKRKIKTPVDVTRLTKRDRKD